MKKICICGQASFPRGDAAANYIEYLALALISCGYDVYVLSRGENKANEWDAGQQWYVHKKIKYLNQKNRIVHKKDYIINYFQEALFVEDKLKQIDIVQDDIVIIYSINYFYIKKLCQYVLSKKAKVAICVVEWHQSFQYVGGILNPVFWLEKFGFEKGIPLCAKIFAISESLECHFKEKGCETMLLPVMADLATERWNERKNVKRKFIYSGNNLNKDNLIMMIRTFASLQIHQLKKIEFHLTGMNAKTIGILKRKCSKEFNIISEILYFHEWMEYEDLIELYKEMDYVILLREKNKVTISNFPSKIPEMMSYGIIPVVSDVGDYTKKYLTDEKDCILIRECSINCAKKGIEKAITISEEEKQKLSINACRTVKEKFYYKVWSSQIQKFLEINSE